MKAALGFSRLLCGACASGPDVAPTALVPSNAPLTLIGEASEGHRDLKVKVTRGVEDPELEFTLELEGGRFLSAVSGMFWIEGQAPTLVVTAVRVKTQFELEVRPRIRRDRRFISEPLAIGFSGSTRPEPYVDHKPRHEVRQTRTTLCQVRHRMAASIYTQDLTLRAYERFDGWVCQVDTGS